MLSQLWASCGELAALESELGAADAAPAAAAEDSSSSTPLWLVDFRRVRGAADAMSGPIPVCSLDGRVHAAVPAAHAARMRERSPRLADALRVGRANYEFWTAHAAQPEVLGAAGADAAVFREQVASYLSSPGALHCKTLCYFLDTYDDASPHRPGALASQVYVGIVGSKDGDQVRR